MSNQWTVVKTKRATSKAAVASAKAATVPTNAHKSAIAPDLQQFFCQLVKLILENDGKIFGGTVRDWFCGDLPQDIDAIMSENDQEKFAAILQANYDSNCKCIGEGSLVASKKYAVYYQNQSESPLKINIDLTVISPAFVATSLNRYDFDVNICYMQLRSTEIPEMYILDNYIETTAFDQEVVIYADHRFPINDIIKHAKAKEMVYILCETVTEYYPDFHQCTLFTSEEKTYICFFDGNDHNAYRKLRQRMCKFVLRGWKCLNYGKCTARPSQNYGFWTHNCNCHSYPIPDWEYKLESDVGELRTLGLQVPDCKVQN